MKLDGIREIANRHGIKGSKLKKKELVKAIQRAEGNEACFASGRISECGQSFCLWRDDCA